MEVSWDGVRQRLSRLSRDPFQVTYAGTIFVVFFNYEMELIIPVSYSWWEDLIK